METHTVNAWLCGFNMQDSDQYSINTEASRSLQLQVSIKDLQVCKSYINSDIAKMKVQTNQVKTLVNMILTCELLGFI